jgi:hypothetical protein
MLKHQARSIRPFIGAKNFEISKAFYNNIGFQEIKVSSVMSYFQVTDTIGFYLQNAYVEDWINNLMIFLEVENVHEHWNELKKLELPQKYENVKLSYIKEEDWGKEYFLHDPSGVLWHFGEFKNNI